MKNKPSESESGNVTIASSLEGITSSNVAIFLERSLGIQVSLDSETLSEIHKIGMQCARNALSDQAIEIDFYGRLNEKLNINRSVLIDFYRIAAENKFTFNYHQKKKIAHLINRNQKELLQEYLLSIGVDGMVIEALNLYLSGVSTSETRRQLIKEIFNPSKLRKKMERNVQSDVLLSALGCLIWSMYDERSLQSYFSGGNSESISDDFLKDLKLASPFLFNRDRALVISKIDENTLSNEVGYEYVRSLFRREYEKLNNFGYLSIIIDVPHELESKAWNLVSFMQFFGERFLLTESDKSFFRKQEIQEITTREIQDLDLSKAKFHLMLEGFSYRDLLVFREDDGRIGKMVLIFQKNRRDETLIPCPSCRSTNVRGNSYPSLGVKSWECQNLLCSDRSIYNRGKRFSFKSLLMQKAIEDPDSSVPSNLIKDWRRDVLSVRPDSEIIEMLIHYFSMKGDVVALQDIQSLEVQLPKGRDFVFEKRSMDQDYVTQAEEVFFARFLPSKLNLVGINQLQVPESNQVVNGDSADILSTYKENIFDAAITSPPYYNAREYSQWKNIYLYLHDMYRINWEVHRVLKPGSYYFFNVFDYFDNENSVTFSAMGQKRLTLAALFVEMFKKIGFELVGASAWDKGDVEGKRAFNAGNQSPFYQAPLNCWEHVLIFRKNGPHETIQANNRIFRINPVVKIVKGINVLGHTAPYPIDLPKSFLAQLGADKFILDPFGGSGTTAMACHDLSQKYLLIEKDFDYANLSKRLIEQHISKLF